MDGNRKENSFCSRPAGRLNRPNDDGGLSNHWLWKISNCFSTVEQTLPFSNKTKTYMERNKLMVKLKDIPPPSLHDSTILFPSAPSSDIQPFQQKQSTVTKVRYCPLGGNEASCSLSIHNGGGRVHSVNHGSLEAKSTGTVTCQIGSGLAFYSPKACKVAAANDRLDTVSCHLTATYVENVVSGCQLQPPAQHLSCCGSLFKQLQPFRAGVHKLHQVPLHPSCNTSSFFPCTELTGGVGGHLEDHVNQAEINKHVCNSPLHLHMKPLFLKGSPCCDDCLNKPPRDSAAKIWPNIPPPTRSAPLPISMCNGVRIEGQAVETSLLTAGNLGTQPHKYGSPDVGVLGQQENLPPIGVFWDIENCSVPTGRSAMAVVQRIRERFFQGHREAEFMCVCDISKENKEVIQELNNCQVTVAHINATAKNAADDKLRQSLRRFADTHTAPATVILVSTDVNFASELSDLRHRHSFQIILVHKVQVSDALLQHAHKHVKFEEFVSNLPPRLPEKMPQCHTLLYVYNLPLNRDSKQVSNRLRRLSDNCGGKVLNITGSCAMLRFTSQESAERAQKRMEHEDVFGNKILVSFTPKNKDLCENKNNCLTVEKTKSPKKANKFAKLSHLNKDLEEQVQNGKNSTVKNTLASQGSAFKNLNVRILQELCGMESQTKPVIRAQQNKKQGNESPSISHHNNSSYSPATPIKQVGNGDSFSGNLKRDTSTSRGSLESSVDKTEKNKVEFHVSSPSAFCKLATSRNLSPSLSNRSSPLSVNHANQNRYCDSQADPFANGADIQISNLDYRMSRKELQQILHDIFSRHGKVKNVELSPHTDYQLKATVQMGNLQEAISAVNNLHRYKVGTKRVQVSLATGGSNKSLALLRFGHKLTVSNLYKLTDTVTIRDQPNGRMVCLLPSSQARQSPLSSAQSHDGSSANCSPVIFEELEYHEPVCKQHCSDNDFSENEFDPDSYKIQYVILSLKTFAPQVHSLLHTHEGTVPLLSFPDCYAAEFTVLKMVEEGEGGVPLEHLIICVPGVNIVTAQNGIKVVKWVHNKPPLPNTDPWLLRCKSPVRNPQLIQFSREVIDLLKNQPHCIMSHHKFIPNYHHHFGKQCRVSDYGYSKLMELLEAVPHVLQILGLGTKRLLTLTHRAQVKRFTQDILKLLKSQASKQVFINEFGQAYHWCFSKDWNVTDYGVCELTDLLSEIPDTTICIAQENDDTVISIPKRKRIPEEIARTKQFAKEVVDLMRHQPHFRMPFNKFIPTYHHHFGRQCKLTYYGFNKLLELFECIPEVLQVLECGEEKILVLTETEQINALTAQLIKLVRSQKDSCMMLSDFLPEYNKTFGYTLRLQDYDVNTVAELMQKLCHIAKTLNTPLGKQLQLINKKPFRTLTAQLMVLLMSLDGIPFLTFDNLKNQFDSFYGYALVPSEYGFMSLAELLKNLPYLVEVFSTDAGEESVKLTNVYQFAKNVRSLLHTYHYQQIFLSEFPATYHKYTGEVLQPKLYGYASVEDLLVAISQVVWIKGHGQKRIIVLKNSMKVWNSSSSSPACGVEDCEQVLEDPKRPITLAVEKSERLEECDSETKEETSSSSSNQTEQDLLCLSNQSPIDLLGGPVPSCLPSPQLRPDPVILEYGDLIQFEEHSPNVTDMLVLTEEEKTVLPAAMTEEAFSSNNVVKPINENVPIMCQPQETPKPKSLCAELTDSPLKKPRNKVKLAANFSLASSNL
ncbi:meiosis regulator and mRNA stability factor 1 isoform X2 [Callorhinchus milii]|uniref:meiosis regulator and mRNA stability factor 1 isoform X2 n=1 Tax=Callorhinchus milii TaxID=7868 RepID=UPI001C3F9C5D|nr:meiosis regulator and mRNA stability factor 1 isoform X2 [Callorhinchus milii]